MGHPRELAESPVFESDSANETTDIADDGSSSESSPGGPSERKIVFAFDFRRERLRRHPTVHGRL